MESKEFHEKGLTKKMKACICIMTRMEYNYLCMHRIVKEYLRY